MDIAAPTRGLLGRLSSLGDENRLRILVLLDRQELTVSELTAVLQLPQSTVSRHLKVLADDDWMHSRQDGTSRYYRMSVTLGDDARELWDVSRRAVDGAPWVSEDAERARAVLAARRQRAEQFFSESAWRWDEVRGELFGRTADVWALLGLLDPSWAVADLGAGTGALAEAMAPYVGRVVAIDRSPEMLEAARRRLASIDNVEVREGELEDLPLEPGTIDLALLILVLHYVVDPRLALEEAARVLKPGGRLILLDMREHAREEYRETMGHLWPGFSERQLREWTTDVGFATYRQAGLKPDPDAAGPLLFLGTATRAIQPDSVAP